MRHQQVKVDYWTMVQTSATYLCLALCGWILFKLVHAVFLFPSYLKRTQGNYEKMYEKLEEKCKALGGDENQDAASHSTNDDEENHQEPKKIK